MLDEFDHLQEPEDLPESKVRRPVMSGVSSLVLASFGLFFLLKDGQYYEPGHYYYYIAFGVLLGVFFWGMYRARAVTSILVLFLAIAVVSFAQMKYDWRQSHLERQEREVVFQIEYHIDRYPFYEEYLFADWLEKPDWIRFNRECLQPAMLDQEYHRACASLQLISERYHINVRKEIEEYRNTMARTATRIEQGLVKDKRTYISCIQNGQCVPVPLLPQGVDPAAVDPESDEYLDIRRAFWSLIDSREITSEICDHIDLCRVMKKTGAVRY